MYSKLSMEWISSSLRYCSKVFDQKEDKLSPAWAPRCCSCIVIRLPSNFGWNQLVHLFNTHGLLWVHCRYTSVMSACGRLCRWSYSHWRSGLQYWVHRIPPSWTHGSVGTKAAQTPTREVARAHTNQTERNWTIFDRITEGPDLPGPQTAVK